MKKFITFLIIGILVLILIAGWYIQRNLYSRDSMRLEILSLSEVEAGQRVEYIVRYKNNGDIRVEEPVLVFEFPSFSQEAEFPEEAEAKGQLYEIALDDIYPGDERTFTFSARVFGQEQKTVTAKASLSYRPKNLRVRYESETTVTAVVKSIPLTFELDIPSRLEPEKEFVMNINYFSNIDFPLTDLMVKINYPSSFELVSAQPRSVEGKEWSLGVLNKADGGRIRITGILGGDIGDTHNFSASIGLFKNGEFLTLKETTKGIGTSLSPLLITYQVNGSPTYSARPGEYLYYDIRFKNIGSTLQENLFLTVNLDKSIMDLATVQPGTGQFQRSSGMIVWDSTNVSSLRFLPVMEEGKIEFWVRAKENITAREAMAKVAVSIGRLTEEIETKIKTNLDFSQQGYYYEGPFTNYGGPNPTVGLSTSYTVKWRVHNYNNNVENLVVKAVLPTGVRMTGEVSPRDGNLSFDASSREVIWNIGKFQAGEDKEIFFQISFDPLASHRGDLAGLVSEATATGRDEWTDEIVEEKYRSIITNLPDDPRVTDGVVR